MEIGYSVHWANELCPDLSSLFNWNTKQVFAYVTATYPGFNGEPPSTAIIWDAILAAPSEPWHQNQFVHPRPKSSGAAAANSAAKGSTANASGRPPVGILSLPKQRPKYQITDVTGKVAERANCTLELGWNVQPWVGVLTWRNWDTIGVWKGLEGGRTPAFDFPSLHGKQKTGNAGVDTSTVKGREANQGSPS